MGARHGRFVRNRQRIRAISQEFDVQYRALAADLSQEGFIGGLADATNDLDIGLVVSNADTPNPGEFLKLARAFAP